ncbi:MAG: hypothetical protein KJZ95_02025 [Caldilinea sp.]|nr:hypothetical protein [Caldilinea sp.]
MFSKNVLYYGVEEPLPAQIPLRAGPLSLIYENGDLRYIKLGAQEIVRRIYVAVRDRNWGTLLNRLSNVEMQIGDADFVIRYDVENREGDVDFTWKGEIIGGADGVIHFKMEGVARATFIRNRIGFCVLHPASCAGARARILHVDGSSEESQFPLAIAPQRIVDGVIKPVAPFEEMAALAHEVTPDVWAIVTFHGDIFEMEDQRNWTDASFKSYCTPLRLPFPVEIAAGTKISQAVTLSIQGPVAAATPEKPETVALDIDSTPVGTLPLIGLGVASHGQPLTAEELARLRALHLHHLRVDLKFGEETWKTALRQATEQANRLGVHLEAALHFTERYQDEVAALAAEIKMLAPPVWSWLIFRQGAALTPRAWLEAIAPLLRAATADALIGSGTDAFFTELNRSRPLVELLDLIAYSINPQVHAFDNTSLVETLATQGDTVRSARTFVGNRLLAVSPVTLRMRSNPSATAPQSPPPPGTLPPAVDPRQMSLLGAGWTVGSLKHLAESGADSVTYYETTGWRGVMERASGSPLPERFRSAPGMVFPLYHVLADVGAFAGGQVLPLRTSEPLLVDGIAIDKQGRVCVLLANLSAQPQTVIVRGLAGEVDTRVLDEETAHEAMLAPEVYRSRTAERLTPRNGVLELTMSPFAVVRLRGERL